MLAHARHGATLYVIRTLHHRWGHVRHDDYLHRVRRGRRILFLSSSPPTVPEKTVHYILLSNADNNFTAPSTYSICCMYSVHFIFDIRGSRLNFNHPSPLWIFLRKRVWLYWRLCTTFISGLYNTSSLAIIIYLYYNIKNYDVWQYYCIYQLLLYTRDLLLLL